MGRIMGASESSGESDRQRRLGAAALRGVRFTAALEAPGWRYEVTRRTGKSACAGISGPLMRWPLQAWLVLSLLAFAGCKDAADRALSAYGVTRTTLRSADLREARLVKVRLRGADMQAADLTGADIREADLSGAQMQGAQLDGVNAAPLWSGKAGDKELFRASDRGVTKFVAADLTGSSLRRSRLESADFTGAKLTRAVFDDSDLSGAQFTRASLQGASLKAVVSKSRVGDYITGSSWGDADLRGARLENSTVEGAFFQRNLLEGASFRGSFFKKTLFSDLDFRNVDLRGTDFSDATFQGVKTAGAIVDARTQWPRAGERPR